MRFASLQKFLTEGKASLSKGPIGLILVEDSVEVDSTIRHHLESGFKALIVVAPAQIVIAPQIADRIIRVDHDMLADQALETVINGCTAAAPAGTWFFYCYNGEYLFYPFCENRSIAEMLAFNTEERRDTVLTFVVDLYAGNLDAHPTAVAIEDAHIDKSGYYALARPDRNNNPKERQLDFFGGLRWRFEEHIPAPKRRIDRVAIFRSKPGLKLLGTHLFNDEEYNTYACPWHHNLSAALCSFRTAKALKRNPGSTFDIHTFKWHNSTAFGWHSQQLLDLGLIEPGQWF